MDDVNVQNKQLRVSMTDLRLRLGGLIIQVREVNDAIKDIMVAMEDPGVSGTGAVNDGLRRLKQLPLWSVTDTTRTNTDDYGRSFANTD